MNDWKSSIWFYTKIVRNLTSTQPANPQTPWWPKVKRGNKSMNSDPKIDSINADNDTTIHDTDNDDGKTILT